MLGIAKYVPKLCVQLNPLLVFLWLPKLDCWKCRTIEFYWSENEHSVWVLSSPSQCCSWLEYSFTIFILFCSFWYVWALQFESLIVLIPLYNPVYLALFWLGKHWSHIWNLVPLCLMWCIWRERIGGHLRTWIDPMTNCLLSFLVPFMIGLGLGDSHLVILFLYSLALSIFVFSVFFFMFLLLHLFLYCCSASATLHLAVFWIYMFLPYQKKKISLLVKNIYRLKNESIKHKVLIKKYHNSSSNLDPYLNIIYAHITLLS